MRWRRRIGDWLGRARSAPRADAATMPAGPAPRPWHDAVAHAVLPTLMFERATLPEVASLDLIYDAFEHAGRQHGLGFDEAMDAADAARIVIHRRGALRLDAVLMPPVLSSGEAHLVALVRRPDAAPRCAALVEAEAGTALVEIAADGRRLALGPGPRPEEDAALDTIATALGA